MNNWARPSGSPAATQRSQNPDTISVSEVPARPACVSHAANALKEASFIAALYRPSRRSGRWRPLRCRRSLRAIFGGTELAAQIKRAVDQANVAVGLRKVAQHAASRGIELLSEQADVIAAREQTIEQPPCFRVAALQHVIVDKPKAAGQKCSFARRQAVLDIVGLVAQDEFTVDQQLVLDGAKRSADPRIGCGQEADDRKQQQAGVEPLGAIGLHEAVEVAIKAALADFRMHVIGKRAPAPRFFVQSFGGDATGRAIEGDPSHDLRMNEVL